MEIDVSKCEYYSDNVGCYITFDGKCTKGNCFTYKLLQENKELKDFIKEDLAPTCQRLAKENEELRQRFDKEPFLLGSINNERIKYLQCLDEIEKICKEYSDYPSIEEAHIAYWANQILQLIKQTKEE